MMPLFHGQATLTAPPEYVPDGPKPACNLRLSFTSTDPARPDPLTMAAATYGVTARTARTLTAGMEVVVFGRLRPVRRGARRGEAELVVDSIAVIPEPDDPAGA